MVQACLLCLTIIFLSSEKINEKPSSYIELIYKAEEYIVSGNFNNALKQYNEIFEIYNSPRAYDYYNALLCAINIDNKESISKYLKEVVKRGFTIEYLKNPIVYDKISNSSSWIEFEKKYSSYYQVYVNQLNKSVIKDLEAIVENDEKATNEYYFGEISQLHIDSLYFNNMKKIMSLINEDNLPRVESFNLESRYLRSILPFIIFRHYFGMYNRVLYYPEDYKGELYDTLLLFNKTVEEKLILLINTGKLSPLVITESIIYNNPKDPFGKLGERYGRFITTENNKDVMVEYVITRKKYSENEMKQINTNRNKWKLPEFQNAIERIKFYDNVPINIDQYFNLNGQLFSKEYYIDKVDSLKFHQNCEKNLRGKLGLELEWIYLGEENGIDVTSPYK